MKNYDLWRRLTFKTLAYRKNFDFGVPDDDFLTEYEGTVSELRVGEKKLPFIVGEYNYTEWNISLAEYYGVNLMNVLKQYIHENSYIELSHVINEGDFWLNDIDRLIILHNFVIHPDYRKKGVTEEFIETIYRDHFSGGNNKFLVLVKPLQNNTMYYEHYAKDRIIKIKHSIDKDGPYEEMLSYKYFGLSEFEGKEDEELNHYRLYALASRCGFNRVGESSIFDFNPEKISQRLDAKRSKGSGTFI